MAEPVTSTEGRGQLDQDAITPAEPNSSSPGKDNTRQSCAASEKTEGQDINDEEKAMRIADEDLNGQRKQVRLPSQSVCLGLAFDHKPVLTASLPPSSPPTDLQWFRPPLAQLAVDRRHLRRHRHVAALRVVFHLQQPAVVGRSRGRPQHPAVVADSDRHGQIHPHRAVRRRRRPGRHLRHLQPARPVHAHHRGRSPPGPHPQDGTLPDRRYEAGRPGHPQLHRELGRDQVRPQGHRCAWCLDDHGRWRSYAGPVRPRCRSGHHSCQPQPDHVYYRRRLVRHPSPSVLGATHGYGPPRYHLCSYRHRLAAVQPSQWDLQPGRVRLHGAEGFQSVFRLCLSCSQRIRWLEVTGRSAPGLHWRRGFICRSGSLQQAGHPALLAVLSISMRSSLLSVFVPFFLCRVNSPFSRTWTDPVALPSS